MLSFVKDYLNIEQDWGEDDTLLLSFISAAQSHILNVTGVTVDENNDLHKLAVCMLVSDYYENRFATGGTKISYMAESILTQISFQREIV
ncbi:head-tail connector protein [Bacillus inaquosorum]|uniref:head-tail connector protein n=1 Tax=Bacillus inaquosorum TaxID=483913 RepID=UPI002282ED1B|nr:head-tail connector protein [Bacillus inaquosorum]MCY8085119.1 head-tail connector protein [Bacillus inaquosorum]MCY8126041.1 head-tail connector protein [Bacillus spizizenii]